MTKISPIQRNEDEDGLIPDTQDHDEIDRRYGPLPRSASNKQKAYRYQLAQAAKTFRLYDLGMLPLDEMHSLDKIIQETGELR
jgi:hypothetical protein